MSLTQDCYRGIVTRTVSLSKITGVAKLQANREKMLFKVALLTSVIGLTAGFIPTSGKLKAANILLSSNGKTITHPDMTRQAILRAAAEIFIHNPNPNYPKSSEENVRRLLNSNEDLDISELINAYFSGESASLLRYRKNTFCKVIDTVVEYNGKVDSNELRNTEAHFDSEQFEAAQNRLIHFRNMAVIVSRNHEYDTARKYTGRLLHTLQDFYSHTNWIENWVREVDTIGPYYVLGEINRVIENVAELTNPCSDCTYLGKSSGIGALNILSLGQVIESTSCYECDGNLYGSLKSQKLLTSGYSQGGKDTKNNIIVKPHGKCSHGGIIDGSTDQSATGGINKDSMHPKLASHHYYHREAASVAQQHSYQFLLNMRNDLQNDQLFSKLLGFEFRVQEIVSIAIVIDTTSKNVKDLIEIQRMITQASMNIQQYMNNAKIQYILVPLSDTGKHPYVCIYMPVFMLKL